MQIVQYIISAITHPLLIATYGYLLMFALNPFLFGQSDSWSMSPLLAIILFSTFFIPLLAVVLMKLLGLVKSIEMKQKEERIGPIFAAAVLYSAFYYNISRSNDIPVPYLIFLLGTLISIYGILLVNLFEKLSMHAVGVAGLTVGIVGFYFNDYASSFTVSTVNNIYTIHTIVLIIVLLLISGLVGSIRIWSGAHRTKEVYMGYFVGILGQVAAIMIYG